MKILIINKSYALGGAAIASTRLLKALKQNNVDVKMMVFDHLNEPNSSIISLTNTFLNKIRYHLFFVFERFYFVLFEKNAAVRCAFSPAIIGVDITKHPAFIEADIIHLSWVNKGFLSIKTLGNILNSGKSIVFTLHDMWTFTGGCHHSWACTNYFNQCGNCKFLRKSGTKDLSNRIFSRKKNYFSAISPNVVSVSNWLNNKAIQSGLFTNAEFSIIPNINNSDKYRKISRNEACEKLELDLQKKYILFGAYRIDDEIKGIPFLIEAVNEIAKSNNNIVILLFGKRPKNKTIISQFNITVKYFGIADLNLKLLLYSAADLTCIPSLYETFGLIATESMSCETPVVAFNNSGLTEIVDHLQNGYLAEYESTDDLSKGIKWVLENNTDNILGKAAREKVIREFSEEVVAQKYIDLYQTLLNDKQS